MGCSQNLPPQTGGSGILKALFTWMSSRPCSARMRSKSAATEASSLWSQTAATPVPPASVTLAAVVSMVSSPSPVERPVMYTVAPASPRPIAMPRPMPRLDPVTTATLPVNGAFMGRLLVDRCLVGGRQ